MTIGIVRMTDKNFRITIPEEIRKVEDIKQGDYIQVDIVKMRLNNSNSGHNDISNLDRKLKQVAKLKMEMMEMNKKIQKLSEELEASRECVNEMEK